VVDEERMRSGHWFELVNFRGFTGTGGGGEVEEIWKNNSH